MSLIDKINSLNNPSLRTKLLAKFTKDSEREEVLQYIKKWQTNTLVLRLIASIFSFGLVPLIYLLWAKSHSQPHVNWVTKSTVDANDAMTKINSLSDEEEKEEEEEEEEKQKEETDLEPLPENEPKPAPQVSEEKPDDTASEHSVHTESIVDEDDKITAQHKFGGKSYHGTQLGSLFIVNKGKVEQYHFKHLPIINIDITEITKDSKTVSIILLCYANGSMDMYNLAGFSQKLKLPSCGKWFKKDPKNNTVTFDQAGNLRAQLKPTDQCKDGKFIIIRKKVIFDHIFPPTQSQAALTAKERNKLTSSVQSSQSEEESTLSSSPA